MSKQVTPAQQLESMRNEVILQELSARSWKAMRSKMEDTIAIATLQEEYDNVVKAMDEKRVKAQEEYNNMIAELQKQMPQDNG